MEQDIEMLKSDKIDYIFKVLNEYVLSVDGQKVKIRIYLDDSGYHQMDTSHYYRGSGMASVYTTSACNFNSEEETLIYAKKQLLSFYDGKGEWMLNEDF